MRFSDFGSRVVFAAFDGGEITSDAGVLLLRERARQIELFERIAACFADHRDPDRVIHHLPTLLAQRVCGIALGYEDTVDHDILRFDPALKLLAEPKPGSPHAGAPKTPAPLAGSRLKDHPTMSIRPQIGLAVLPRNHWPLCVGMRTHPSDRANEVVAFRRNRWSQSIGTDGRHRRNAQNERLKLRIKRLNCPQYGPNMISLIALQTAKSPQLIELRA